MLLRLLLLFTLVPLVELALLLWLGSLTSWQFALGLVLATGIVGGLLARHEGLRCLSRFREELTAGRLPADPLIDGLMILLAGALLITPGVLTDLLGFALLLPGFRRIVKRRLKNRFQLHFHVSSPRGGWPESTEGDHIVDTRVIDVPPETPRRDD